MRQCGRAAIKVIVVVGVLAFAGLYFSSAALKSSLKPNERERVRLARKVGPFDGARAFATLERLLALGPRPSGSPALTSARAYIADELRRAGVQVREHEFTGHSTGGSVSMTNVTGVVRGARKEAILIGTHYDTMPTDEFAFVGANSAAAGAAWLLEMARTLGASRDGRTFWFVWFDGGEADSGDPNQGSRAYVEYLRQSGEWEYLRAVIIVSRVGDCYLALNRDPEAPEWLTDVIWDHAAYRGYGLHFGRGSLDIHDDHTAFREAGAPAIALMDASYGGSRAEHTRYWHTEADTIERICPASLQAVGDVLYDAFPAIDARLDASPEG